MTLHTQHMQWHLNFLHEKKKRAKFSFVPHNHTQFKKEGGSPCPKSDLMSHFGAIFHQKIIIAINANKSLSSYLF